MTCLPHPLYADDTSVDEWVSAAGAIAGLLSSSALAGPIFSNVLAGMALAFGTGAAIAASSGDGDFDWSGFSRSMTVMVSSTVLYGSVLGPLHVELGNLAEGAISTLMAKGFQSEAAAVYASGAAAATGTFYFDPLINYLLDLPCTGNEDNYITNLKFNSVSPLVIDMDLDNHADLISLSTSPVFFSQSSSSFAHKTGWLSSDDALLAKDNNLNGIIDGRHELFGDTSSYINGFENLTQYDQNHDNIVNNQDAVYSSLLVWQDSNVNGYSEQNELQSLQTAGISEINLNSSSYNKYVEGQRLSDVSTVKYSDGTIGAIWDVWFSTNNINSLYNTTQPFSPQVFDLPQLDGIGDNKDLWRAMTDDSQLLTMVENFKNSITSTDLASHRDTFENILFKWFGTDWLSPDSNDYVDARAYASLSSMNLITSGIPTSQAQGDLVKAAWDGFVNTTLLKFAAQIPSSELVEAHHLALEHLKNLQNSGISIESMSVPQLEAEIVPYFSAGSDYASNHPLKVLGLDYDFNHDIIKGNPGRVIEGLVAGIPSNISQQESYWDNKLLLFDGIARTNRAMGASVTPIQSKLIGTASSQTLTGGDSHDLILGEAGNDLLIGGNGDDVLFGGTGNDTLVGGEGQNTYYWNTQFGNDVVDNKSNSSIAGREDVVIVGDGIDPETVIVEKSGNDFVLHDPVTSNSLRIIDQFNPIGIQDLDHLHFSNGEIWDHTEIEDEAIASGITEGNDNIIGLSRGNTINGRGGNDTIDGGWGDDTLDGGAGGDILTGGKFDDVFKFSELAHSGGTLIDRITDFSVNDDTVDLSGLGFTGLDTDGGSTETGELRLAYSATSNRTYIRSDQSTFEFYLDGDYRGLITNSHFIFGVTISSLIGSSAADSIIGTGVREIINSLAGNDTLVGGGDNDTLDGGADKDILTGGAGRDVFRFSNIMDSNDTSSATFMDRITDFEKGWDKIDIGSLGFTGLDTDGGQTETGELRLAYSATSNRTYVRSDQSTFEFYLDGDYSQGVNQLTDIDFIFTGGGSQAITITGSSSADNLNGTDAVEVINGLAGSDTLVGGGGNDTLDGGADKDVLTGGAGADVFKFSNVMDSNDTSSATFMDRITDFVKGTDKIDIGGLGFTGLDTDGGSTETGELRLAYSATSNRTYVRSDQSTFEFYLDGDYSQGVNQLTDIDFIFTGGAAITINGSSSADSITGTDVNEVINGLAGNDTIIGGTGNDTLDGGADKDVLTGGAGADTFKFSNLTHSVGTGNIMDRITDFVVSVDKLNLSGLGFTGLDTDGGYTETGEIRISYNGSSNRTYVRSDTTDFQFYLDGDYSQGANQLTNADFVF